MEPNELRAAIKSLLQTMQDKKPGGDLELLVKDVLRAYLHKDSDPKEFAKLIALCFRRVQVLLIEVAVEVAQERMDN